jgi:hypothetical protein
LLDRIWDRGMDDFYICGRVEEKRNGKDIE